MPQMQRFPPSQPNPSSYFQKFGGCTESPSPCPGMREKFRFAPLNVTQHQRWCSTHVRAGGNGAKRDDFNFNIFFFFSPKSVGFFFHGFQGRAGAMERKRRGMWPEGQAAPGCDASSGSRCRAAFPTSQTNTLITGPAN